MITLEEARTFVTKVRPLLHVELSIEFADMPHTPALEFFEDSECFYNPAERMIHIGWKDLIEVYKVDGEEEFLALLKFRLGHEKQHVRSTATGPYAHGVQMGCEAVIDYIAKKEKICERPRGANGYPYFANVVLPGHGIYISWMALQNIVAGIFNAVEDGRIERIRSNRFPGFESLRLLARGRFWSEGTEEFQDYSMIRKDPVERLRILTNQVLCLATTQLFQKGFAAVYEGTRMMDDIKDLMPYIAAGVMAGRTRHMAENATEICRRLAPFIYEACKASEEDLKMKQAFEKMIADMIKALVDSMPDTGLSERDEDTDEGSLNSTFPSSDLVVTLDDETYDKLVRNTRKGGGSGGIMVTREHPLPEDESHEGSEGKESESGNGPEGPKGPSTPGTKGSTSSEKSKGPEGEENSSGNGSASPEGEGSSSGNGSNAPEGEIPKEEENSPGAGDKGTEGDGKEDGKEVPWEQEYARSESSPPSSGKSPEREEGSKNASKFDPKKASNASLNAVEKAMQEAAEKVTADMASQITNVNVNSTYEYRRDVRAKQAAKQKAEADTKPLRSSFAEEFGLDKDSFEELMRKYKVTDNLPPDLARRAAVLRRKNEMYFKSLSTPNVRFLDSGAIDPSRIFGLSFGDTEVFRKIGRDKKFDGCIYMLVDNSGSMRGGKRTEACKAAAVAEESFKGLIPLKIVAFDEDGKIFHEVIKGWNEQFPKNCSWNFCLHGRQGSGNEDGYDIQIAVKELLQRPEKRKLLIVLSDGAPGDTGLVKSSVSAARKKGVKVCGIYFEEGEVSDYGTKEFRDMYERDYICCSADKIDENLSRILKDFSRS